MIFKRSQILLRRMSTKVFKEEKIDVGGVQINYLKAGNGPKNVLCLPGALGTIWTDFKPQLEGLSESMTVIAWDPPGYGKSRPPMRIFGADFYQSDANAALSLIKALGLNKCSLLGWSDGGITALIMAARSPLIDKLVVWGANAYITQEDLKLYNSIKDTSLWSPKMRAPFEKVYGEDLLANMMLDWYLGLKLILDGGGDICKSDLPNIKCPTLILHGEKDSLVPKSHVDYLLANIKHSKYQSYPDGKHNIHLRYPEDFNARVKDFIVGE